MRTTESKNQTQQLPSLVVAEISKEKQTINLDLNYISSDQAKSLIKMFDSKENYLQNFSAIKAITRGLFKLLLDGPGDKKKIQGMFNTVNNLQGILLLDDTRELDRILQASGLMPDVWKGFNSPAHIDVDEMYNNEGGSSC